MVDFTASKDRMWALQRLRKLLSSSGVGSGIASTASSITIPALMESQPVDIRTDAVVSTRHRDMHTRATLPQSGPLLLDTISLETKSCRILPLNYVTKYDTT